MFILNTRPRAQALVAGCALVAALSTSSLATATSPAAARDVTSQASSSTLQTASQPADQTAYSNAYKLGLEAYEYGLPLVETNVTYLSMTSINVSNGTAYGPVNHINSARKPTNPNDKAVVAQSANGLSSTAWLDLTKGPQVLHIPRITNRYYSLALEDPYTNDFLNLGSVTKTKPGNYVILGPGQHNLRIPKGTHRIDVGYTRIWIVGTTQLKGPNDVANVDRIQDGYTLTPLSKFGTNWHFTRPKHPNTKVRHVAVPTGLQFFDELGALLKRFPAPSRDRAELRRLATVGIGPGLTPSKDKHLSSATLAGLAAAAVAGPGEIADAVKANFKSGFGSHNGYLLGKYGQYGTNYRLRAIVTQIGFGAVTPNQTIYALALTDHNLQPLSSTNTYVLTMKTPPPVNVGWSLSMYTTQGWMVPNSINRYEISNKLSLARNANGSITIYISSKRPTNQQQARNWLPAPSSGGFELIWRLIAPKQSKINGIVNGTGWEPPIVSQAS